MHFWLCKATGIVASVVPPLVVEVLGFTLAPKKIKRLKSLMTSKTLWVTSHKPEQLSYTILTVI